MTTPYVEIGAHARPLLTGSENGDLLPSTHVVPSEVYVFPEASQEMRSPVPGSIVTGEAEVPVLMSKGAEASLVILSDVSAAYTLVHPPHSIR